MLAFYPLHRWVGGVVPSPSIVLVATTGRPLGMHTGLLAGLLAFPVNTLLMILIAGTVSGTLLTPGGLLGSTVILLPGVGVGRLCDLRDQLIQQLARREQAEKAPWGERDFISVLLETATALVVVLDPRGRIVRFNRACERITGYSFWTK